MDNEQSLPLIADLVAIDTPVAVTEVQGQEVQLPAVAEAEPRLTRDEIAVLETTSLGHFVCHLGELLFPSVLLAVKSEFSLTPAQTTLLALLGYVLMGVGAIPAGALADAWGCRRVLLVFFVLMAGSGLAVALAPTMWILFAALTVLGIAASMYHPPGLAMLSLGVRAKAKAMGLNGVAGSLGIAAAPIVGYVALEWLGNWRWAYGILAVLAALFTLRLLTAPIPPAPADPTPARSSAPSSSSWSWPVLLPAALLLLVMTLGGLNYRCLVTALPSYLSDETAGGQVVKGGLLFTSLVLLAGGIGQMLGGWLGDRFGSWRIYLLMVALLAPLSALLGWLGGSSAAVAVAAILAVAVFAQQPVENAILAETTASGRRSLSYGAKFVLTFGIGAFGTQIVGMVWTEAGSLAPVFYIITATATGMALVLMLVMVLRARRQVV